MYRLLYSVNHFKTCTKLFQNKLYILDTEQCENPQSDNFWLLTNMSNAILHLLHVTNTGNRNEHVYNTFLTCRYRVIISLQKMNN